MCKEMTILVLLVEVPKRKFAEHLCWVIVWRQLPEISTKAPFGETSGQNHECVLGGGPYSC